MLNFIFFIKKSKRSYISVRESVFDYIKNNKSDFYIYFLENDNESLNRFSPEQLLNKYIEEYNIQGRDAGNLEYTAICKLYQLRIILLQKGYVGYNVYNIFTDDNYDPKTYSSIFIIYYVY